jgi:hypothetical protein
LLGALHALAAIAGGNLPLLPAPNRASAAQHSLLPQRKDCSVTSACSTLRLDSSSAAGISTPGGAPRGGPPEAPPCTRSPGQAMSLAACTQHGPIQKPGSKSMTCYLIHCDCFDHVLIGP